MLRVRTIEPRGASDQKCTPGEEPDSEVALDWTPLGHHLAYAGALNGGIIGTLMDCHSNWTATWHLMRRGGLEMP